LKRSRSIAESQFAGGEEATAAEREVASGTGAVERIVGVHNRRYPHIFLTVRITECGNPPCTRAGLSRLHHHAIER